MKKIDQPDNIPVPWASAAASGYRNPIPPAVQSGANEGYASWPAGFPPPTFISPRDGGSPPRGQDHNGVLHEISAGLQWLQMGGFPTFDQALSDANNGYPLGAVVESKVYTGLLWRSLLDDNEDDPDDFGTSWAPFNRLRLQANMTIWVDAVNGEDTNSGLSTGQPLKTIGRATWLVENFIDRSGYELNVRIKPGTYTNDPIVANGAAFSGVRFQAIDGTVSIPTTTTDSSISVTGGASIVLNGNGFVLSALNGSLPTVAAIICGGASNIHIDGNISYNASRDANIFSSSSGYVSYTVGVTEKLLANTQIHYYAYNGTINANDVTVEAVGGTRNFTISFADAEAMGFILIHRFTKVGTFTGVRYLVSSNAAIIAPPASATTYLPGSIDGIQQTGGVYINS
jgi:hypothetical protein